MLHITCHLGNTDQSYNEIPPHTSENSENWDKKQQMLERMWRKGNPLAPLVGMWTGTATLENCVEVPQEVKNRATLWPSNCTTEYLFQRYWCSETQNTYILMFIAVISTIAKLWKEPRCPLTDEWIKMWSIYTMECYSAIRKVEYPPFALTWMELEGIMLSEVSQSEKDSHHMVSFIRGI